MAVLLKKLINRFLDLMFPKNCASCFREGSWLCPVCSKKLLANKTLLIKNANHGFIYSALFRYQNKVVKTMLIRMKFKGIIDYAKIFAKMILHKNPWLMGGYILTFVPMTKLKQNARGFNQSREIANNLALISQNECLDLLLKIKATAPQISQKSKSERTKNILNSFALNEKYKRLFDKKIVLIDDVATTGATLNECAKQLKKLKPKELKIMVVASESHDSNI